MAGPPALRVETCSVEAIHSACRLACRGTVLALLALPSRKPIIRRPFESPECLLMLFIDRTSVFRFWHLPRPLGDLISITVFLLTFLIGFAGRIRDGCGQFGAGTGGGSAEYSL